MYQSTLVADTNTSRQLNMFLCLIRTISTQRLNFTVDLRLRLFSRIQAVTSDAKTTSTSSLNVTSNGAKIFISGPTSLSNNPILKGTRKQRYINYQNVPFVSFTSPLVAEWKWSIEIRVSVCLSVCLSAIISQKPVASTRRTTLGDRSFSLAAFRTSCGRAFHAV